MPGGTRGPVNRAPFNGEDKNRTRALPTPTPGEECLCKKPPWNYSRTTPQIMLIKRDSLSTGLSIGLAHSGCTMTLFSLHTRTHTTTFGLTTRLSVNAKNLLYMLGTVQGLGDQTRQEPASASGAGGAGGWVSRLKEQHSRRGQEFQGDCGAWVTWRERPWVILSCHMPI